MLKYRADIRTLSFVGLYFFFTTFAWLNWHSTDSFLIKVSLILLLCFLSFVCTVAVHNTIHCPLFKNKSLNKLFQIVLSFTYGHMVSAFVPGHNFSHHRFTQEQNDIMRTRKLRFRWNFLNQLLFFNVIGGHIIRDEIRYVNKVRKLKPSWFKQYLAEAFFVFPTKIGLTIYDPVPGLLLIWVPHFYAAWGIVGTNFWQHDGTDRNHKYNHSRTFTGKILNFFALNNGYHTAHHMRPGLHWSLLPAWHERFVAPHCHPSLNRKSLTLYLFQSCIYPGKRVDYLGNPITLPARKEADGDWLAHVKVAHKKSMAAAG